MTENSWTLKDLKKIPKNGCRVFSTFACGGGSTMGYKLSGFDVVGANDIDSEMANVYKTNHKPNQYYLMPINQFIKDIQKKRIPENLKMLIFLMARHLAQVFLQPVIGKKIGGKIKSLEKVKLLRF